MTTPLVSDAMTPNPKHLDIDDLPSRIVQLFAGASIHHLPVLEAGRVVGMVSTADMARISLRSWVRDGVTDGIWLDSTKQLRDIMAHDPVTVRADQPLREAAEILSKAPFHSLPVVNANGGLVGILTTTDLARVVSETPAFASPRKEASLLGTLEDELRLQAWLGAKEMTKPSEHGDQLRDEVRVLARLRDVLRLQLHLGRLEAAEQWGMLELEWHRLMHGGLQFDTTAALHEAQGDVRELLGRLRSGYRSLRRTAFRTSTEEKS